MKAGDWVARPTGRNPRTGEPQWAPRKVSAVGRCPDCAEPLAEIESNSYGKHRIGWLHVRHVLPIHWFRTEQGRRWNFDDQHEAALLTDARWPK
jgi:hypothetical protein